MSVHSAESEVPLYMDTIHEEPKYSLISYAKSRARGGGAMPIDLRLLNGARRYMSVNR